MRLDETCSPRKSQHLRAPWFLRQRLHMGCTKRVKFNNKGSQRAESTGSAQRCSQSAQFVPRATRSESKGNGKCLMYWPQIHHGFHLRKESVRNISPPTKRKFQPRSLQLSRGATAWLSTTGATSGAARRIVNLLRKVGRKREEETGPRNVQPGVSAYPSLGLCQIKKDQMISASTGVCAC